MAALRPDPRHDPVLHHVGQLPGGDEPVDQHVDAAARDPRRAVTWLAGPVATYNVLLRLAFALSAFSLCLVLRRWTTWWPAAFVGGLVYGFSPYMVGQGLGHLMLVFVPLPPLILLVLHGIVVRRRRPAWQSGVALGLLAAAQYFISPEVLLSTALAAAVAVVVTAVARRREVRSAAGHVARALAWAAVVAAPLLAYPGWMALAGPQHVIGPPHPLADLARYPGDVLGTVVRRPSSAWHRPT